MGNASASWILLPYHSPATMLSSHVLNPGICREWECMQLRATQLSWVWQELVVLCRRAEGHAVMQTFSCVLLANDCQMLPYPLQLALVEHA